MIDRTIFNQTSLDNETILSGAYWGELRVFLAVAKSKSLSRASVILNTSQPTVSRSIKRLEDLIGSQLLIISNKGVILTDRGIELAHSLSRLDYELMQITNSLQYEKKKIGGNVRLSITDGICGIFVAPAINEFSKRYPNIQLNIKAPINIHQIKENMSDILVVFSPHDSSEFTSNNAGQIHLIPFASDGYIKKFGTPDLNNIKNHYFVDSDVYSSNLADWKPWKSAIGKGTLVHTCESSFSYGLIVRSGVGIGLLGNYVMSEPSMMPVNLGFSIPLPLYIVALTDRLKSRPVKIVFDWLGDILGPQIPWLSDKPNPHLLPDSATREIFGRLLALPKDTLR